jgi:hypothetical protein
VPLPSAEKAKKKYKNRKKKKNTFLPHKDHFLTFTKPCLAKAIENQAF